MLEDKFRLLLKNKFIKKITIKQSVKKLQTKADKLRGLEVAIVFFFVNATGIIELQTIKLLLFVSHKKKVVY